MHECNAPDQAINRRGVVIVVHVLCTYTGLLGGQLVEALTTGAQVPAPL